MKKLFIPSLLSFSLCTAIFYQQVQAQSYNNQEHLSEEKSHKISRAEILENLNSYIQKVVESYYIHGLSREKAIRLITADLNQYMENLYKECALAGNLPNEAYMLRVGIGKSLKENKLYEVVVVEIGLAFDQPSLFRFFSFSHQISSKKDRRIEIDPDNPPSLFLGYRC